MEDKALRGIGSKPGREIAAEALCVWSKATNFLSNNYSLSLSLNFVNVHLPETEMPCAGFPGLPCG